MSKMTYWDGKSELKISADVKYNKIIDKNAQKCLTAVKNRSPVGERRTKKYKDGWILLKGRKKGNEYYVEIWNETNWQLTHLLENGHAIVNKIGGVGWAEGDGHIQKAVDDVQPTFISEMERAEVEVDIK